MRVDYSKRFKKQYQKLTCPLQEQFKARLIIFVSDPLNPVLGNHVLHGRWNGFRSINITGDFRAIYQDLGAIAFFVAIGTHSKLYS